MGFMDKAKKLADQAQAKIDEVQQQFNESQSRGAPQQGGAPVEYDKHGRPIDQEKPHGDPMAQPHDAPQPPADKGPELREDAVDEEKPQGDPLGEPRKPPTPPSSGSGLSSGDPLSG